MDSAIAHAILPADSNDEKRALVKNRLYAAIATVLVVLTICGCLAPRRVERCKKDLETPLQQLIGQPVTSRAEVELWLMQEYGVRYQDGEVGFLPPLEEDQDALPANLEIRWRSDGRGHLLQSVAGAGGKVVISFERMLRPTLKRAVDCLGMPEAYWAWYGEGRHGGKLLSVLLLYPKDGTIVVTNHFGKLSLNANGNQLDLDVLRQVRVDELVFLPPDSSQALLDQTSLLQELDQRDPLYRWYVDSIKPWPQSWSTLEVSTLARPD